MTAKTDWSPHAIYGLLVLTMAAWGGTFVAGRLLAQQSPPLTAAFWRFVLACLVMVPLTWKKEGRVVPRGLPWQDWVRLFLLGLTGVFGYNYFFIKGLTLAEAGRASVIVAINPAMTYLGAAIFFGERLTVRGLVGFSCALLGVLMAITRGRIWNIFSGQVGTGELLIGCCVLCWVAYSLIGKVSLDRLSPMMSATWGCLTGLILLAPAALWESGPAAFLDFNFTAWAALAYLGFLGTALGFPLYYLGILHLGAPRAVVFVNLVPLFGLLSGWLVLGEHMDWSLAVSLALVLAGIRLIQKRA